MHAPMRYNRGGGLTNAINSLKLGRYVFPTSMNRPDEKPAEHESLSDLERMLTDMFASSLLSTMKNPPLMQFVYIYIYPWVGPRVLAEHYCPHGHMSPCGSSGRIVPPFQLRKDSPLGGPFLQLPDKTDI